MNDKTIHIIGAGIAGLSAGCYAQMNGYRSRIFEMHSRPGGLCTSWERNGYTINGCVQLVYGTGEGTDLRRIWDELGALPGRGIFNFDEFVRFEGSDGRTFVMHANVDRLAQHMLELAPGDRRLIDEFIAGIRKLIGFQPPVLLAPELYGPVEGLKLLRKILPYAGVMRKWVKISAQDFGARFTDPLLREAFSTMWFADVPVLAVMLTIVMLQQRSAGYPVGGSLEFSRAIERRYLGLGGRADYHAKVREIIVEGDRAVGIRLEDGTEHRSDYVIAAADSHSVTFDLLHGRYLSRKIARYYEELPLFPPVIYVALGLGRPLDGIPLGTGFSFPLAKPITMAGETIRRLTVRAHDFDPTLAPAGKSLIRIIVEARYAPWKALEDGSARYREEKQRIEQGVIAALNDRFPGAAATVEMCDVATPLTFQRHTGNWQGSHEGWLVTTKTWSQRMKKTLPGLDRFYLAGQWVEPGGGVPSAAMSGRHVVQILCRRDRRPFVATNP